MKKGWEEKKLDDACKVEYGTRVVNKRDGGTIYPVYGGGGATFLMDSFNRENCLVIARFAMSEQCTRFVDGEFYLNDSGLTVNPKNTNEILQDFLDLQMLYLNDYIYSLARGAAQKNLDVPAFRNIEIYYPKSLSEQQCIVQILNEALKKIAKIKANAERNLQNAKELFQSALMEELKPRKGWEEKTLEQISISFGRGKSRHRPRNDKKLYDGDYPFIQTGDIRNCEHFVTEYAQTYNEAGLAQSKLWPKGTICITIAANIAETGILSFDACFPDSVIGIVVNDKFADIDFVEYMLQSFKAKLQALGKGSAQDNINMGTFENELFPFPSIKAQQTIVEHLDSLSAHCKGLEANYQKTIAQCEEMKKAVLGKAFRGEL